MSFFIRVFRQKKQLLLSLVLIFCVFIIVKLISVLLGTGILARDDFVEYWSAARLAIQGKNPYDPELLFQIQKDIFPARDGVLMMWNPPWSLAIFYPLSQLNYLFSRFLWLLMGAVIILYCSDWFWLSYGGSPRLRWISWIIGITFAPSLFALKIGQIGPLIILGMVGFLSFIKNKLYFLAGISTLLVSFKPQLFYLFFIVLILWVIKNRNWEVSLGLLIAGSISISIVLYTNHQVIGQYIQATRSLGPLVFITPTIGSLLRIQFGSEISWLQFLPSIIGATLIIPYWLQHSKNWDWSIDILLLIPISLITTSFGWSYDQIILLPLIIQGAVIIITTHKKFIPGLYLILFYWIVNGIELLMNFQRTEELYFILFPPIIFLGFLISKHSITQKPLMKSQTV